MSPEVLSRAQMREIITHAKEYVEAAQRFSTALSDVISKLDDIPLANRTSAEERLRGDLIYTEVFLDLTITENIPKELTTDLNRYFRNRRKN